MSEPGKTRSVIVERELSHPPEKVWRALTQPHLIEEWLMQNDFKPVIGHRFNLRRTPKPDLNIVVDCEVLEVEPRKTLSYTWSAFDLQSIVTWTLTPTPRGTHLRMEQQGFGPDHKQAQAGATAGWITAIAKLEEILARADGAIASEEGQ
ncbi:MAG TPA: SRPBCC domain-containing protein [Caulobacterales bacterium]|nr:SRPBCC domain-containing protein [Caulobacterales bacterium]